MIWCDVLLSARVADEHLRAALARSFAVDPDEVRFFEDEVDLRGPYGIAAVLYTDTGPQFPLRLSLYTHELAMVSAYPIPGTLQRLAAELGEQVLTPADGTPNPYLFKLYLPTGEIRDVSVEVEALDEREEYLIDQVLDPDGPPT
jgi:hypothetical protein